MAREIERAEPPYVQVVGFIRDKIHTGELVPGAMVPSARKIIREWQVSMATATKVLAALRSEGLVEARPGIGTVVSSVPSHGRGVFVRSETDQPDSVDGSLPHPEVEEIRAEIDGLRRQFGRLEALLIDLYGRTGQPFPHERQAAEHPARKAAG